MVKFYVLIYDFGMWHIVADFYYQVLSIELGTQHYLGLRFVNFSNQLIVVIR